LSFLHQHKHHVVGKDRIEDVLGDIAAQIHPQMLAENLNAQRRTQLNEQAIKALSQRQVCFSSSARSAASVHSSRGRSQVKNQTKVSIMAHSTENTRLA
jgi:hypothetical protein